MKIPLISLPVNRPYSCPQYWTQLELVCDGGLLRVVAFAFEGVHGINPQATFGKF